MITIEELTVEVARQRDALKRIEALVWYEPQDDDDTVEAVRAMVRERDEARAEVEVLRRERDEARAHTSTAAFMRVERQRDEARAQVKAWQAEELARRTERDEARAEVGRLRARYGEDDR